MVRVHSNKLEKAWTHNSQLRYSAAKQPSPSLCGSRPKGKDQCRSEGREDMMGSTEGLVERPLVTWQIDVGRIVFEPLSSPLSAATGSM